MQIGNAESIADVADWVEFYICVSEDNRLSKSELASLIEDSSGSEPTSSFLDDIWNELDRRLILYGDIPPFDLAYREVISTLDWKDIPEYLTCIILSIDGNSVETVKTGKLFERLSCKAVKEYFKGDAIIYGFPSKQGIEDISNMMNETFNLNPSSNFKDRGVDIICWKSFGDYRKSQLAAIIQCAAGHNWSKKLLSIPLNAWKQYMLWSDTLPIKGFTTPIVVEEKSFFDIVTDAGLMFDRPRLYRNIQHSADIDSLLRNDLITWCELRIADFKN